MTQKNTGRSYTQSWLSQGFTLIELLVVVLIIGILAAIAVPQYQKAVEKSRLTEVKTNLGIINKAIDLYMLQGGALPLYVDTPLKKVLEETGLELSGGNYATEYDSTYLTKDFVYNVRITPDDIGTDITNTVMRCAHGPDSSSGQCNNGERLYVFETHRFLNSDYQEKYCYHKNTAIGRKICKEMEEQGYAVSQ